MERNNYRAGATPGLAAGKRGEGGSPRRCGRLAADPAWRRGV